MQRQSKLAVIFFLLFLLPFAGVGVYACYMAVQSFLTSGDIKKTGFFSLFAVVFGGVGIGGILILLRGLPRMRQVDQLELQHPKEPWLWRPEWSDRRIVSDTRGRMTFHWGFAIFWNLVSSPMLYIVPRELSKGNNKVLVALLFPLVGIGLLAQAVHTTWLWYKFGVSTFVPETLPGVIGGALKAAIHTDHSLPNGSAVQLKLICVERTTTRSSDDSTTWEKILWESGQVVVTPQPSFNESGSLVPVAFPISRDCRGTAGNSQNGIQWVLRASCAMPGLDYQAEFEVPVFVTAASPSETVVQSPVNSSTPYHLSATTEVKVQPSALGGTEFLFPPFRHMKAAVSVGVFSAIFSGATAVLWIVNAPLIFTIVFGFFSLLLMVLTLSISVGQTRVVIEGTIARIQKGVPGWAFLKTDLPGISVLSVRTKIGMQSGQNVYYDLQILKKDGRKVAVGSMIADKREAEWLAAEFSRLLKVSPTA